MISRIRPRLNHATIVAYLALFVALGGSSYSAVKINGKNIKNKSIAGKKLKNRTITRGRVQKETLTGTEVNESTLGKVPSAARADTATSASTATSAGSAGNASTLEGIDSSGFLRNTPPEAFREVGAPGQPAFGSGWSNENPTDETTAAFFMDAFGIVHLKGIVLSTGSSATIFTLPPGYRPTKSMCLSTLKSTPAAAFSCIQNNGAVENGFGSGSYLLDGISFRAGAG